jgi:hypothetical protein
MDKSPDTIRRWVGLSFLGVALGLLILGVTVLAKPLGRGVGFLFYWLACFVFTALALLNAILDFLIVRSRARRQQQDLARHVLTGEGVETDADLEK